MVRQEAAIVIRRFVEHIEQLKGGVMELAQGQFGFAREDRTLVCRDTNGEYHHIKTDTAMLDLILVKKPVETADSLPDNDVTGTLRMVLNSNSYYFKTGSNWVRMLDINYYDEQLNEIKNKARNINVTDNNNGSFSFTGFDGDETTIQSGKKVQSSDETVDITEGTDNFDLSIKPAMDEIYTELDAEIERATNRENQIETDINARIDGVEERVTSLENLGVHVGSFDTFADLPTSTNAFVHGITINDYANIRNYNGNAARFIAEYISGNLITWKFDMYYSQDVTGKADNIGNISAGNGTETTTPAQTSTTVWDMLQNIWNRIFALANALAGKAPANISLNLENGTGTDTNTPAVSSNTIQNIVQAVWAKIRQLANVINGKQNALNGEPLSLLKANGVATPGYCEILNDLNGIYSGVTILPGFSSYLSLIHPNKLNARLISFNCVNQLYTCAIKRLTTSANWGDAGGWRQCAYNEDIVALINDIRHSIEDAYLPKSGGTMNSNARITWSSLGTANTKHFALYGTVGDNDQWAIGGGQTGTNAGFLEIATGDDGNEPIYVRQYSGGAPGSGTIARTATLLDASGFARFPSHVFAANNFNFGAADDNSTTEHSRLYGNNDGYIRKTTRALPVSLGGTGQTNLSNVTVGNATNAANLNNNSWANLSMNHSSATNINSFARVNTALRMVIININYTTTGTILAGTQFISLSSNYTPSGLNHFPIYSEDRVISQGWAYNGYLYTLRAIPANTIVSCSIVGWY